MKKQMMSIIFTLGMSIAVLFSVGDCSLSSKIVYAAEASSSGIIINDEHVVPDQFDWCTYYVVVATNDTGCDVSVSADFVAYDGDGNALSTVHDQADAVKAGQQFILYGQFLNENIKEASRYDYGINISETDTCTYSVINLDANQMDECIEVSATNYSENDIQGVGIRTLYMNDGEAVGFDTVNIADVGYTFHGGSTNSQIVGCSVGEYDDYIMTYTSAGFDKTDED